MIAQTCKNWKRKLKFLNEFDSSILVWESIYKANKLSLVVHAITMDN